MPAPVPYSLEDAEGRVEASCEIVAGDVDELLLVADETELTLTDVSIGRFAAALDDPVVDEVAFDVELEGVTPPAKIPFVPVLAFPVAALPEVALPAADVTPPAAPEVPVPADVDDVPVVADVVDEVPPEAAPAAAGAEAIVLGLVVAELELPDALDGGMTVDAEMPAPDALVPDPSVPEAAAPEDEPPPAEAPPAAAPLADEPPPVVPAPPVAVVVADVPA